MPGPRKLVSTASRKSSKQERTHETVYDELDLREDQDNAIVIPEEETPVCVKPGSSKASKKRAYHPEGPGGDNDDDDDDYYGDDQSTNVAPNVGGEMQKMLECFGADVNKSLLTKKRKLEQFTKESIKSSNKKVEDVWKAQATERQRLNEEYCRQVALVFGQWEEDLTKSKDQEEKLVQSRTLQSARLKTIRQLHESFTKGMEELESSHNQQQGSVQSELRKEMALLQKKILMDTQQQDIANVRKSLQTMLLAGM
ncbi:PREDICTED: synaptonemal complex protein 3-like isoform X2 [Priapulus caudatus]|uniref:Synaptonemal complex protein 3-like isoform X2 n=1 Tax=Priapulus caudatus TaxID=37621 RepID=A0ABM1EII7_PRICU|nr:PREDICTED: synaptonemal complex protein 3-like isoform X2 [Priapulus caudatus]